MSSTKQAVGHFLTERFGAQELVHAKAVTMCRADAFPAAASAVQSKAPQMAPVQPSDYQPRMIASELITAIQRCALGDKEQLQAASELSAIFINELHQLLVFRPNMQAQVFRQILPAVQRFLSRKAVVDATDACNQTLANANKLLAAASSFVALSAEQHTLLLKDEGTLEVAVQSLKDLWNEGRPSMLLDENIITAQQSLISIILELAECSGQGRSDLLMTALKNNVLRDHLCWLWRVGNESSHPVLSQAALLSEQVLRILGVEHSSLDHLLCQAPPMLSANATRSKSLAPLPVSTAASSGQEDLKRTATLPTERSFRSWFRSTSARRPYTLVAV